MPRPKIVFLYSEIAGYFLASVEALSLHADVLIVRWQVNKEAPFNFIVPEGVDIVVNSDLSYKQLYKKVHGFNPDLIVCSGWMDKTYLKLVKSFKKQIPTVLSLDNHWTGSLKQHIAKRSSPFFLKDRFTHAWVPGEPQKKYAEKLGFKDKVLLGYYCADTELFNDIYKSQNKVFKKQFLYVGRYVEHKGIFEMWKAFIEIQKQSPSDWELLCIGTGEEWENRIKHPKIKHLGFVQPNEMKPYLSEKSVYILPSKFEPWGVSVQEFAITSCPLILSRHVGAHEKFLEDGSNGDLLQEVTVNSLKNAMTNMMSKTEGELMKMSQHSHNLGMSHTPEMWAKTILRLIK